jgi:hypothetical protein
VARGEPVGDGDGEGKGCVVAVGGEDEDLHKGAPVRVVGIGAPV